MSVGAEYFLPDPSAYPEVKIGGKRVDLRELLTLDSNNLAVEYATITHWLTTIGYKLEAVEAKVTQEKRALTKLEAAKYLSARKASTKVTESTIKAMVAVDPEIGEQQKRLDAALLNAGVFKVVLRAVESKRDMVVNLGAELRKRK